MFIYLPVPDLLISWLKSHKSVFAQSLWFRVSIRLAIFLKWPSAKTHKTCACLFFCFFLWLLGCGVFFCAVTRVGTHSGGVMMSLACTYQSAAPHLEQTGRQRGQSQDFQWVVFFFCCLCFVFFHGLLITPVRWKRSFHTGISSDMFRFRTSQNSFNSFVTSRSHFTSSQTRYWPLLFNWIFSKRI